LKTALENRAGEQIFNHMYRCRAKTAGKKTNLGLKGKYLKGKYLKGKSVVENFNG
jgi:hypothetical protein